MYVCVQVQEKILRLYAVASRVCKCKRRSYNVASSVDKCKRRSYDVASSVCVQVQEKILRLYAVVSRVCKCKRRSYDVASSVDKCKRRSYDVASSLCVCDPVCVCVCVCVCVHADRTLSHPTHHPNPPPPHPTFQMWQQSRKTSGAVTRNILSHIISMVFIGIPSGNQTWQPWQVNIPEVIRGFNENINYQCTFFGGGVGQRFYWEFIWILQGYNHLWTVLGTCDRLKSQEWNDQSYPPSRCFYRPQVPWFLEAVLHERGMGSMMLDTLNNQIW